MHRSHEVLKLFASVIWGPRLWTSLIESTCSLDKALFVCALLTSKCITQIQDSVTYSDTAVTSFEVHLWIYC